MITCGGCGREIDTGSMDQGEKLLCGRCYHLQVTTPDLPRTLGYKAFTVIAALCLLALALAGLALCVLYLVGTGDLAWFFALTALMVIIFGCPAAILVRRRNLSLLVASLYLPLGIWAYLWRLAPGVDWEYGGITAYGGFFFFAAGLIALGSFIRDMRALPRL
jgi:hypothetical protein